MKSVHFSVEEEIPVLAEADVLVVGGGPGGLGAAVMAARMGASVVLAERFGILGGMASYGEVTPFMWNHVHSKENSQDYQTLDKPVYPEWIRAMAKYIPSRDMEKLGGLDAEVGTLGSHTIQKDAAALAAEDLCLNAGVRIFYHFDLVKAIARSGVIDCAVFATKSGFAAIRAKNFVDATGDADLTVLAGGKADFGGPAGYCQPMTLCFKLEDVDKARIPNNYTKEMYEKAKAEGKIHCPRENLLTFLDFDDDVIHFNTTRVVKKSAVNAVELSEAEVEGHRQLREIVAWLRAEVPGFENAKIRSVASHIGIRESRRIRGVARLNREAFTNRQRFPDAVARCNYAIDIHNPEGTGTEIESMPNSEYFEIPYGCIVPEGMKNLTVGGRPVSVDHAIHSSTRVMPPAISMGQAAGVAAAMSAKSGIPVDALSGAAVRAELVRLGANL